MQDAPSQAERVRAAMQRSLDQQRASVQKQAQAAGAMPVWSTPPAATVSADCDPIPRIQLTEMIAPISEKRGVDPSLVEEVARQESGFRPCAVSAKGAEGLMQLMPATQAQFDVNDPFDAKQNLDAGTKLLKILLDRYDGDLEKTLGAYNAGPTRVDKAGGMPQIPETKNYVVSILGRVQQER